MENTELTEEQKQDTFNGFLDQIQGTKTELPESKEIIEEQAPVESEPVQAPTEGETKPEPVEDNPLAFVESLDEKSKAQVLRIIEEKNQLAQRDARLRGQVSALDRNLKQERLQRAEYEKKLASQPVNPPKSEAPQKLKDYEQALAEQDPNFKEYLEWRIADEAQRIRESTDQKIQSQIAPIHEFREQEVQQKIVEELDKSFAGWQEIVFQKDETGNVQFDKYSPHWEMFGQSLSPSFREVVMAPKTLEDAVESFRLYEEFASKWNSQYAAKQDTSQADAIAKKREQDLKKTPVKAPVNLPMQTGELNFDDEKIQKQVFDDALKFIQDNKPNRTFKSNR